MRIGLDVSAALAGPSGMRFYVESLARGLAAVDRENEYFLYAAFWSGAERLESLDLPRAAPNFKVVHRRFPQRLLFPFDELGAGIQERWFRELRLDVFHGLGHVAPPMRRIPTVVTVHHVGGIAEKATAWDRFYLGWLTPRCARRADAVIAVSEFTRREAMAHWGLDPAKATVVHEGRPPEEFRPSPSASPAPDPYILFVGSFFEHKNVPTLLKAFSLWLARDGARRERLILAGRPGRDLPLVRRLIGELGLASRVQLLLDARREEIISLYQGALMVVVPSLLEGFGFPVLEAMACGAPALVSDRAALPEVAGDAALLFDALDEKALSGLMERVANDAGEARRLRQAGLDRVKDFDWREAARGTLDVYRGVTRKT